MSDIVQTIDDFLRLIRKSGLVEDERLEEAVAAWPDRSGPLPAALLEALVAGNVLTQWQIDQLRKGRHKGFVLGKYRLLRLLGSGGMSSVYVAEHTTLHGLVAIKVLPVKRADQTSYLARFKREAREAFRLNHPHIVRTIDLDDSGDIHFLAMEYVEGTDLQAKVKQGGPLDAREAADFIRQAALGLQHAHDEGLVHRDIKPANLILDKRGTVKILDFGLALAGSDADSSLTQAYDEKILGTADYLAPEQARDSHAADRRSDIYALGCTLYYLLTGRPPFAKGSITERLQAHLKRPPPNLLDDRPDVPPAIVELYFRMLEKHPDARPQTAREVADALAAWLAATAAGAPRSRPETPRRPPPRRQPEPAADPGSSNVHFEPPLQRPGRSGPGSGSDGQPAPRGAPLRRIAATATAPPSLPAEPAGPGTMPAVTLDLTPPGEPAKAAPKRARKPLLIAGLPLGFWLLALGALVMAGVLGFKVLSQQKERAAKSRGAAAAEDDSASRAAPGTRAAPTSVTREVHG